MNPVSVVALFGAGVASFLAPCVLPLMPAYVGMLGGEAARDRGSLAGPTVAFVSGFTAVFAALGALAGALGSRLADLQLAVERGGGLLIIGFGLALLVGRARRTWSPFSVGVGARPFVLGVAFGATWTPCVGPLLGAALVIAAGSGSAVVGAVLLVAYAAGVGTPFVAVTMAADSFPGALRRVRTHLRAVELAAGITLLVLGSLLVTGRYATLIDGLARFSPAVG